MGPCLKGLISSLILIVIYLSQTGLKLVLTINPYISTNSENFDVGVKGQEISEGNSDVFNSLKKHLKSCS